ncbi:hypothetical protein DAPK24_038670 [Pichia kluyveri]|uniref:Uncharacterized protein n=1 Tax=Pichia kluyveri TaxID=36015 RepID=A0AAV5R892_PICKL|nr:hypothetical protein DAPK24_038670 [Pichia kluyveri]
MTIDDIKPLTQEMIDDKIDETQAFLSSIYIFREAVKVDHLENKLDCDNDDDDLDLPDELLEQFLDEEGLSEDFK